MPWDTVVSKIRTIVNAKKPYAWTSMDQFLKHLHWGYYHEQCNYSNNAREYGGEYVQGEYTESDEIVEKVVGIDYLPAELDELELQSYTHGTGLNNHSNGTRGVSSRFGVLEDFAKLSISDKRHAVESC
jgi:hypothetical protein